MLKLFGFTVSRIILLETFEFKNSNKTQEGHVLSYKLLSLDENSFEKTNCVLYSAQKKSYKNFDINRKKSINQKILNGRAQI